MSLKNQLLSVSLFCHLASIILCALILSETLALYKSFTYLLTYLNLPNYMPSVSDNGSQMGSVYDRAQAVITQGNISLDTKLAIFTVVSTSEP